MNVLSPLKHRLLFTASSGGWQNCLVLTGTVRFVTFLNLRYTLRLYREWGGAPCYTTLSLHLYRLRI